VEQQLLRKETKRDTAQKVHKLHDESKMAFGRLI